MPNVWIFSNKKEGRYEKSDWDMSTILKTKKYYFKESESNRSKVKKGDIILLREYAIGFWGTCEVSNDWVPDKKWKTKKLNHPTGWFPIKNVTKWRVKLPYEIIRPELSNQNFRLRIAKANFEDKEKIELAKKIYINLGYGDSDGDFFVLESGLEEAVKVNLSQLGLRLAEDKIQQQCDLGIGVGRTDLICRDEDDNFVVLELKAVQSSDYVIGQILRYMGYIRENWAKQEKVKVSGIVITPSFDEQLRLAAKEAGIQVLRIRIT